MRRRWRFAFCSTAAVAAIALLHVRSEQAPVSSADPAQVCGSPGCSIDFRALRSFSLIDQRGAPITDRTFRGHWLIVFFGFTHCPELCPTTLYRLDKALAELGARAQGVRVLFITVDPERDTSQVLATYLQPFGRRFVGATGTAQEIAEAAQAFRAYTKKQQPSTGGLSYTVDHSTSLYVVSPEGRLSRQLSAQTAPQQLAATLRTIIDRRY